jgi:hypothetical protein
MLSVSLVEIVSSPPISFVSALLPSFGQSLTEILAFNLTAWGYQDCQFDKEDGSYGGMLTKLLFRTLPDQYPAGSALAHFPFYIPKKMHDTLTSRNDGSLSRYRWPAELGGADPLPPLKDYEWKVVNDLATVKQVLTTDAAKFASNVIEREKKAVVAVEVRLSVDIGRLKAQKLYQDQHAAPVAEAILNGKDWIKYFKTKTEYLLKDKMLEGMGSSGARYVDIVKDVINLLPIHWICEEVVGIFLLLFAQFLMQFIRLNFL